MKVTNRNARIDRAGKHNDRNFNLDNASHIDQSRVKDNKYYTYNGDYSKTFDEIEKEFYELHFSDFIDAQNERNAQGRHKERNRSIEQYLHNSYTRPEDKILQIGNIKEHATGEELWECALEYKRQFEDMYGEHCKILDMALHLDEETPHVHVRRVWIAQNENGIEQVSQKKALEQLGIMDPDQNSPNSKYNNAKITFTKTDTALFRNICIEKGLDIDYEPAPEIKQQHLSVLEYKKKAVSEEIGELERQRDSLGTEAKLAVKAMKDVDSAIDVMENYIENNPHFQRLYMDEIEAARKKDKIERLRILAAIYRNEMETILERTEEFDRALIYAEDLEARNAQRFIDSKDLREEFEEFKRKRAEQRAAKRAAELEAEEQDGVLTNKKNYF